MSEEPTTPAREPKVRNQYGHQDVLVLLGRNQRDRALRVDRGVLELCVHEFAQAIQTIQMLEKRLAATNARLHTVADATARQVREECAVLADRAHESYDVDEDSGAEIAIAIRALNKPAATDVAETCPTTPSTE